MGPLRDLNQDQKLDWIRDQLDLINEGKIDLENVSNCFVGAIKNEQNDRIKASLLSALGRLGNQAHVEVITPFLHAKNDRVRANAVEALGYLLPPGDRSVLLNCFEDHNNRVVGNAIMALSQDSPEESKKAMQALCQGSNINEQLTAVYCIGALAEDDYLVYSDYLLESSYSEVREKILKVLEDLSQDLSNALRILKQWNLRIAAFDNSDNNTQTSLDRDLNSFSGHDQGIEDSKQTTSSNLTKFTKPLMVTKSKESVSDKRVSGDQISSLTTFDKTSLIMLSGIISFAVIFNLFNALITDRYSFYKLFLEPVRYLLVNEWLHAGFFIIGLPSNTFIFFIYKSRIIICSFLVNWLCYRCIFASVCAVVGYSASRSWSCV